jgi:glucose-6-phosphate 1-dehydrogenase
VVGVAHSSWSDDDLRERARGAVATYSGGIDEEAFARFARLLSYVGGDYRDPRTFGHLRERLQGSRRPLFYLAIPPSMFDLVVDSLAAVGLHRRGRVLVEKPFGRDLPSARALNRSLHRAFPEEAILRIDHFLAKETVQNLLVFRFANAIIEPVWDRRYISSVQVTMAEAFGIEGRGAFYEEVGALRDVVQNHLLQVVALLAMEPPVGADAEAVRDEKVKVFRSTAAVDPGDVVRGQYHGYRQEEGVAPDSQAETYAALRIHIDSWRWAGVPFWIRAGKRLKTTALEATIEFREPPRLLFADPDTPPPHPNHLRFRLGGLDEGIALTLEAKEPGETLRSRPVDLGFTYEQTFGAEGIEAYERLLSDAIEGRAGILFARQEGVEQAWRILTPALENPAPIEEYVPGSWGPARADALIGPGGWHDPEATEPRG